MRKTVRCFSAVALLAALSAGLATPAVAQTLVVVSGDVSPADRPFVDGDQGIPSSGTTVETDGTDFLGNPVDGGGQPLLDEQGRVVGQFDYERNFNVEVGRDAVGQIDISDGGQLRYGDLIIGGNTATNVGVNNLNVTGGEFGIGGLLGDGTVSITGTGSLFNNHPLVIPTEFQDAGDAETTSFTIPTAYDPSPDDGGIAGNIDEITDIARDRNASFDLYVGLTGSGLLEILDGGRAEIRDGVFVGAAPEATGNIIVDGAGSTLQAYGNAGPVSGGGGNESMLIGLFGEGRMSITNGARVIALNGAAIGALDNDGSGSSAEPGGFGEVRVDGPGSVWRVITDGGPTLAVGEFTDGGDGNLDSRLTGLAGGLYEPDDGSGVLRITGGGFVDVIDDGGTDSDLRIGEFGEIQLTGGRVAVADRIDSDGVIRTGDNFNGVESRGSGVVEAGAFLNSPLGRVRVRSGERLTIRSTNTDAGENIDLGGAATNYFYANAGLISALGDDGPSRAEVEFDRATAAAVSVDSFRNLLLPGIGPGGAAVRGQIVGRDANFFFNSGLLNEADVRFTGGENLVTGLVLNELTGVVRVSNDAFVEFQDDVTNNGLINLSDDAEATFGGDLVVSATGTLGSNSTQVITVGDDLLLDGRLEFVIGGGQGGIDFTRLDVLGNAVFGPGSVLSLDSLGLSGVVAGDTFDIISVGGGVTDGGAAGLLLELPPPPTGLAWVPDTNLLDGYTLALQELPPIVIVGADLTGDGVVDARDLAIWFANNGLQSGATIANGDLDGDGDVDTDDFLIIQSQFGMPPTPLGGGAPALSPVLGPTSVPEPTSAALLLAAGVLWGGRRRSRQL